MLLSKKNKFIFIHIHKAAGQSIANALMPYAAVWWQWYLSCIVPYRLQLKAFTKIRQNFGITFSPQPFFDHIRGPALREKMGHEVFDSYYSFAFVRNPYEWVYSNYTYALANPRHKWNAKVRSFSHFEEYCNWLCIESGLIKYQKDYVFDINDKQVVNFIGKQENLAEDFRFVTDKIGIEAELRHYNRSRSGPALNRYSPRSVDIVSKAYEKDFLLLGYEFA